LAFTFTPLVCCWSAAGRLVVAVGVLVWCPYAGPRPALPRPPSPVWGAAHVQPFPFTPERTRPNTNKTARQNPRN
tara:strand:+ start:4526 stop:4750 length:225 start_codon:yes stop_codon:yes gene_type:complete